MRKGRMVGGGFLECGSLRSGLKRLKTVTERRLGAALERIPRGCIGFGLRIWPENDKRPPSPRFGKWRPDFCSFFAYLKKSDRLIASLSFEPVTSWSLLASLFPHRTVPARQGVKSEGERTRNRVAPHPGLALSGELIWQSGPRMRRSLQLVFRQPEQ